MISKKEVRAFITPYLKTDFGESECTTETITRYVHYNKEMVEANKEKIYKFIIEQFNVDSICIYLERLLEDKNHQEWNSLKSFDDLELLEELLGLGIVSGLLEDDLRMRLQVIRYVGQYAKLFNPEIMDLSTEFKKNAYLSSMRNMILPVMFFKIDEKIYNRYKTNKREFTHDEKKSILRFWFKEMNSINVSDDDLRMFNSIMDDMLDDVLNAVVILKLMNQSSETFLINMKIDRRLTFIKDIVSNISNYSPEQREYFEEVKQVFLTDIEKMKQKYDGNDGMKKTLH